MISLYINTIDSLRCESLGFNINSFAPLITWHDVDTIIIISRDFQVLKNNKYYFYDKLCNKYVKSNVNAKYVKAKY